MGDDVIGRLQNPRCRTVVVLKFNNLYIRKVIFKAENDLEVGSAPAINCLGLISNYTEAPILPEIGWTSAEIERQIAFNQHPGQRVLNAVGVLKLVDQNVTKALVIVVARLCRVAQELHRHQQ
jgi:hypothetical protein